MDASFDLDALVRTIHRTALDRTHWREGVSRLVAGGCASYVNFRVCRPHDQRHGFEYFAGGSRLPGTARLYAERFAAIDPIPYFSMSPGVAMDLPAIYRDADPTADPFYTAFLKPSGMAHLLIVRCAEPSGFSGWLTLGRAEGEVPFGPAERDVLATLARHIPIALENWAGAEKLRIEREVYSRCAATMQIRALLLDDEGCLLEPDVCENGLAAQIVGLRVDAQRRLRAVDGRCDAQLQAFLQRLRGVDGPDTVALRLGEASACDLLLARLPHSDRLFRGRVPRIAVLVRGGAAAIDQDSIARLFNLSPREAQLTAQLVAGLRVAEASRALGLTEETGRTYAKRVLAKTGLSSQTDLVRRILTSSAPLAHFLAL